MVIFIFLLEVHFPVSVVKKHHHHHQKKDHRKSPATLANALGPALFSTPDIIRRVSVGNETGKCAENSPTTPVTPTSSSPIFNQQSTVTTPSSITSVKNTEIVPPKTLQISSSTSSPPVAVESIITPNATETINQSQLPLNSEPETINSPTKLNVSSLNQQSSLEEESMDIDNNENNSQGDVLPTKETKIPVKVPLAEELQSSLDPGEFSF